MLQGEWHTEEDFEADLRTFSEIQPDPSVTFDEPPPPSLLEYQARLAANSQSIYDADFHHSDEVTYVISGRGRGGISKIYKPGAPVYNTTKSEDDDIRRRIRQESGVLGYDRMIEEKYARLHKKPETILYEDAPDQDVGAFVRPCGHSSPTILIPTYSTSRAGSDKSSNKNSKLPSPLSSGSNTPTSVSIKGATSTDLESSRSSENSSPVTVTKPVTVPVLPLSELRRKARKKLPPKEQFPSDVKQCSAEKENKDAKEAVVEKKEVVEKAAINKPSKVSKNGLHSSPSSTSDTVTNDYWWRKSDNDTSTSGSDEPLSWRKRNETTSPRFFKTSAPFKWNNFQKPKQYFDVQSDEDFPPLK